MRATRLGLRVRLGPPTLEDSLQFSIKISQYNCILIFSLTNVNISAGLCDLLSIS